VELLVQSHEIDHKVRDLAGEILKDWDAVIAFSWSETVRDCLRPTTTSSARCAMP
jgi:hypothetical protein